MNHLNEAELIEYYYGEHAQQAERDRHLASCAVCSAAYLLLADDVALLYSEAMPVESTHRGADYGESVWQSLRGTLTPYEKPQSERMGWLKHRGFKLAVALASAAVILAAVAFYSGRQWEQKRTTASQSQSTQQSSQQPAQRVVLLVLGDHLDRSERLLVELNHPEDAIVDPALQSTARQLLAENRTYSESSSGLTERLSGATVANPTSSAAVTVTLNDLDRVLAQVADSPNGLSRTEIARVQREINASGLLFEVRVMRSRVRKKQTGDSTAASARQGGRV